MNKFSIVIILIAVAFLQYACLKKSSSLSEETIQKYIAAYSKMRTMGAELTPTAGNIKSKQTGTVMIEKIVKDAGFKNLTEFMSVQVSISAAMSAVEADIYKEKMTNLADELGDDKKMTEQFSDLLNNPDIPEPQKENVRKQIQKSKVEAASRKNEFEKKRNQGQGILNMAEGLTDKESIALVKKYHKQLRECMTGIKE